MSENILQECRLCLKTSNFYYSLFDKDVTGIIESFTSIKIEKNDDLPSTCCSQCLDDIYLVNKIRCRIIDSDKILRDRLINRETASNSLKNQSDIDDNDEEQEEEEEEGVETFVVEPIIIKSEDSDLESDEILEIKIDSPIKPETKTQTKLECTECKKTFRCTKTLEQHKSNNHCSVSVCKICDTQIKAKNYRRHLALHKSGPQICELCGAVAKNAESLRGHMFYMHKSSAEQYKCKQCGKFYRYKYKFELHVRKAHGGDRSHICEVCGKAFFTARDVNRHIQMTHMKLRPYICQYCNKGFSSSSARRTHLRQHTNERPYICELCKEGFKQRVSLKSHYTSKHGLAPLSDNNEKTTPTKV